MSSIRRQQIGEEAEAMSFQFHRLAAKKLDEKVRPYFKGRIDGWLAMRIGRVWREFMEENPEYDPNIYESEFAIVLDDMMKYWRLKYRYFG